MQRIVAELRGWIKDEDGQPARDQEEAKGCCGADLECRVCEELLALLAQYASGLTEAVLLTQLHRSIAGGGGKGGRPRRLRREESGGLPGSATVEECRRSSAQSGQRVVVQASVSAVTGGSAGAAPTLQLADESCSEPIAMLVHSGHKWLLEGPRALLTAGSSVRTAAMLCRPVGCSSMLMPSAALVVCVAAADWGRTVRPERLPGPWPQVWGLGDIVGGGVQALQQERCSLNGWLQAAVESIGVVQAGFHGGGASSRTGAWCFITLRCAAGSGCSVRWLLLDDAAQLASLLHPGERVAMYCPTVRRYSQAGAAAGPELVLEAAGASSALVLAGVGDPQGCENGEPAAAGLLPRGGGAGPPGSPGTCAHRVLAGVVSCVRRAAASSPASGAALQCVLSADPAAEDGVPVRLEFLPGSSSKVPSELRDGHTLLLTRASQAPAAAEEDQVAVLWREGDGGAAADLSCTQAVLGTPCLQRPVSVEQLLQGGAAGPQASPGEVIVLHGTLEGVKVAVRPLHRDCGWPVAPLDADCHPSSGSAEATSSGNRGGAAGTTPQEGAGLWSCRRCSVDCATEDTALALTGHATLSTPAPQGGQASSITVQVDPPAWRSLVCSLLPPDTELPAAAAALASESRGSRIVAAAYALTAPAAGEGRCKWALSALRVGQ